MKKFVEYFSIAIMAIGLADSMLAYFEMPRSFMGSLVLFVTGLLLFLIYQLETMDDRWM